MARMKILAIFLSLNIQNLGAKMCVTFVTKDKTKIINNIYIFITCKFIVTFCNKIGENRCFVNIIQYLKHYLQYCYLVFVYILAIYADITNVTVVSLQMYVYFLSENLIWFR